MDENINKVLEEIIKSNYIMTLGTIINKRPHLTTVFYVSNNNKTLYFKSRTSSDHSVAFAKNQSAAVSIYNPKSTYSEKSGLQSRGRVERVRDLKEMAKVVKLYGKSFIGSKKKFSSIPELVSDFVQSTIYRYTIEEIKIIDSASHIYSDKYIKVI